MKRGIKKSLNGLMAVVVLATTVLSSSSVYANTSTATPQATDGANETSRSMISFFREERTGLQVERTSKEEVRVYGVFLSNFFVPYHTKLGDIINDKGDKSFPKEISNRFFGSDGKSKDVLEINKKVYGAINDVLSTKAVNFAMLKSPNSDKAMTGNDLIAKIAKKDKDRKIYGMGQKTFMDLSDPAFQATFQLLYGLSPTTFFGGKNGLGAVTGLYMDGFGNVWGKYGKADIKDYVLILPASMNPAVFPKSSGGDFLFPMTNIIAMGAGVKMTNDFLQEAKIQTPYMDFASYVTSNYDKSNNVMIMGIQSPINKIGNTDSIIKDGTDNNPYLKYKIKDFLNSNSDDGVNQKQLSILVAPKSGNASNLKDTLWKNKAYTGGQKGNIIDYLMRGVVLPTSKIADDMYYFNVDGGSSLASSSEGGSFANIEDLIVRQKLYLKETDSGYNFFNNSYLTSPFNRFLSGYFKEKNKDAYLKKKLSLYDTKSESANVLKNFLNEGTWGTKDEKKIISAMKVLNNSNNKAPYDTMPVPKGLSIIDRDYNAIMATYKEPVFFGVTKNDWDYSLMSTASLRNTSAFAGALETVMFDYEVKTKKPFVANDTGGTIDIAGEKSKGGDYDTRAISTLYHNLMTYRYFFMNKEFSTQLSGTKAGGKEYSTPLSKSKFKNGISIMDGVNNFPGIYWGYMVQLLGITPNAEGDGFNDINPYISENLPAMDIKVLGGGLDLNEVFGDKGVVASEDRTLKEMQEDIIKKVYGILKDGASPHREALIKNTQDSWFVATHRSITGSWVGDAMSVSAGGGNSYASSVGFINTPSLLDIPLADWVLKDYTYVYFLFVVVVLAVLVFMVIINMRTIREGAIIFGFMLVVLLLPQHLITNISNISNTWGDKVFDGKFNYWAIIQHEQSIKGLNSSRVSGDEVDFLVASSMQVAQETYSNDVGVRVRWMSPKKDDFFDKMFNRATNSQSLMANTTLFRWLFNSYANQEEYVYDDPLATYLYRPYNSIAREAKNSYESLKDMSVDKSDYINKVLVSSKQVNNKPPYRYNAWRDNSGAITFSKKDIETISKVKAFSTSKDEDKLEAYRYWILGSESLNASIFRESYATSAGYTGSVTDKNYQAFSLMTESPFYYFYYNLKNRYQTGDASFKSALLDEQLFKVTGVNDRVDYKTRDFLDMEGLFTYVIPYMQQANEYVYGWTEIYGNSVDAYDFNNGVNPSEGDELYEHYLFEQEKKENLKNVWKLYSPWVDQISRQENLMAKARMANKRVDIPDALDPSAYHSVGRPMIFSEADMYAKRYGSADLSDVERRIQKVLETTQRDMMYLTNYYDFDDEVLLTASAMSATFNFNREFSQKRLVGESSTLYPQNYELKNFNFDAFMRLLLLNTTGEPLIAEGGEDLYVRVISKTSAITGMLLIIADIVGVILLPAMKIVTLMLLLYLSIVVSLYCVITPPDKLTKTIWKAIGIPTVLYLLSSGAFAWGVSLLIGEGLTGYVGGRTPSLNLTDPTVTIVLLITMSLVYCFILWKVIVSLFNALKSYSAGTAIGILALGGAVATKAVDNIKENLSGENTTGKYDTWGRETDNGFGSGNNDYDNRDSRNPDGYSDFLEQSDSTNYSDDDERDYDSEFAEDIDRKVDSSRGGSNREEYDSRLDNDDDIHPLDLDEDEENEYDKKSRVDLDTDSISKDDFDSNRGDRNNN